MKHPIRNDKNIHRKTYEVMCKKVQKFYGVPDAERFFQARRKAIMDKCEQDEFGWAKFESLKEWHQSKVYDHRYLILKNLNNEEETS